MSSTTSSVVIVNMDQAALNVNKKCGRKKKRKRTVITPEEIERLENEFQREHRPDRMAKMELAKEMGKSETVVSTWFQNRRAREKRIERQGLQHGSQGPPDLYPDEDADAQPLDLSFKDGETGSRTASFERSETMESNRTVRSPMFARLVGMAAAAEGGILTVDCPNINQAMMDACNGILLKDARLVYHPTHGFDLQPFEG